MPQPIDYYIEILLLTKDLQSNSYYTVTMEVVGLRENFLNRSDACQGMKAGALQLELPCVVRREPQPVNRHLTT